MNAVVESPAIADALSAPAPAKQLTIAVAGNPNAGKTSLFNVLTGLRQKVANYPGVTVESKVGQWTLAPDLAPARLVDLPGLYSLDATSLDEEIARDVLLGWAPNFVNPDAVVAVVDATNLVRNLYLATQVIDTGQPVVVALTMFDLAERSQLKINIEKLSAALGVPVVPVIAKQRRGLEKLAAEVRAVVHARDNGASPRVVEANGERQSRLIKRYAMIERIVSDVVEEASEGRRSLSEKIDRFVTHRVLGPIILLAVMVLVFQAIFSWATLPMSLIDKILSGLDQAARKSFSAGILHELLAVGFI